ncbi:MAG: PilZ domain-containing protein [Proteobacteria bacterium]|nr:PilZ domain-containing protein [Pseudomonadota bacterium]
MEHPERRMFPRDKHRLTCELVVDQRPHKAIVLDLCARGPFVQSRLRLRPGTEVVLRLFNGDESAVELQAKVAHARHAHRDMAAMTTSGAGLEITSAPEAYYQLLSEFAPQPQHATG